MVKTSKAYQLMVEGVEAHQNGIIHCPYDNCDESYWWHQGFFYQYEKK